MSKSKIIFLVIFSLIDLFILAISIGYLVMGIQTPDVIGGRPVFFTGSYILFLAYFLIFVILTTILIVLLVKNKRAKNK